MRGRHSTPRLRPRSAARESADVTNGLGTDVALFLMSAAVIGFFGICMTYTARDLAQATALGRAEGSANIGLESVLILLIYAGTVGLLVK